MKLAGYKNISILLVWLSLVGVRFSIAQEVPYQAKFLSIRDGLPQSYVAGIVQDKAGFIWMATRDGLARYDGRHFKVFRHIPGNINSLTSNIIRNISPTPDGTILILTDEENLQLFDPVTEQFSLLFPKGFLTQKAVRVKFTGGKDGKNYYAYWDKGGLMHFDLSTKKLLPLKLPRKDTLRNLLVSQKGIVYAPYNGGLLRINPITKQTSYLSHPKIATHYTLRTTNSVEIAERATGELIIEGRKSILIYNPDLNSFKELDLPFVRDIQFSATLLATDNSFYFGMGDQLFRLTPSNQLELLWQLPPLNHTNYFKSLLLDNSGVLWIGTNGEGVIKIDLKALPFKSYPHKKGADFCKDLLGQELGVKMADLPLTSPREMRYTTMKIGGDGWYLQGLKKNIYHYINKDKRLQKVEHPIGKLDIDKVGGFSSLKAQPEKGFLWFYVDKLGIIQTDTNFRYHQLYPLDPDVMNRGMAPDYDVSDLLPHGNMLWIASSRNLGLFLYDLKQKKVVQTFQNNPSDSSSLTIDHLVCLAHDPSDSKMIWIGTYGAGLCRLDTRTMKFLRISEKQGLPNGTINTIIPDPKGFLWISTNQGITRLDPKTLKMRHFTIEDGLQDTEYNRYYSAMLPDGRMALGGISGMTVFDPLSIKEDTFKTPVVLTSLKINNELVKFEGFDSPLSRSLNDMDELVLKYNQNFLTFEFAGLEYNKPEKIIYRYQLIGIDKEWLFSATENTANYTNLSPGKYIFEVMATNTDGIWSPHTKQLKVVITPPFWMSWWAYGLYSFLFIGAIVGFICFRIQRIKERQEVELNRREAQHLQAIDEMKTRFFSNITHEFRTPLSLIISPIENLLQQSIQQDNTKRTLFLVYRNAKQLLQLINHLLDLSKLEANTMHVALSRGNVENFINRLVEDFQLAANQKNVRLEFTSVHVVEEHLFDAEKWEKIITNLLSNALKFSLSEGKISIDLQLISNKLLQIRIADTGIGIPAEKLSYIFDRFYQVDDSRTRAFEGTGIGLALVKELIMLLGGSIQVESQVKEGTTFTLRLPVKVAQGHEPLLEPISSGFSLGVESMQDRLELMSQNRQDLPLLLIVEDNIELCDFMRQMLSADYRVLIATNGVEALPIARQQLPDVVISDIMMPEMDGFTLCEKLKTDSLTDHLAVVLLTARCSHERRIEGLSLGADDYITKPFHFDELKLRLRNLLDHQQKLRDHYQKQLNLPEVSFTGESVQAIFLQKIQAVLEQHVDNSDFGPELLAVKLNMTVRTLSRKLNVLTGMSPAKLMRNFRLRKATQLLKAGYTVSDTAYQVGFESPSYFATAFKEFYGKTPSEFAGNIPLEKSFKK